MAVWHDQTALVQQLAGYNGAAASGFYGGAVDNSRYYEEELLKQQRLVSQQRFAVIANQLDSASQWLTMNKEDSKEIIASRIKNISIKEQLQSEVNEWLKGVLE